MKQLRLKQNFIQFSKDKAGNFAIIFAMLLMPIMVMIGGAIDFHRVFNTKEALRACMESAALALPQMGIGANASDSLVNSKVNEFITHQPSCSKFVANANPGQKITASFTARINRAAGTGKGRINVTADATVNTYILGLIGIDSVHLGSNGGASQPLEIEVQASTKVEIALVLDTTGSMGWSGKMNTLKTAVSTLLDDLKDDDPDCSGNGNTTPCKNIRVGMVPFSYRINIGTPKLCNGLFKDAGCTNQSKKRIPGWLNINSLPETPDWNDNRCKGSNRNYCSYYSYGQRRYRGWWRMQQPRCQTFKQQCDQTKDRMKNWSGCVLARSGNRYTDNSRPTNSTASKIKAESRSCSFVKPIHRITGELEEIRTAVNALNTQGSTNTAIGLEWGWRLISRGEDMGINFDETGSGNAEVKDYDDQEWKKVVILMTDGDNTTGQNGDGGWQTDSRTLTLCTNIKNKDVKIFTIAFRAGSRATTLMKSCATKDSYFFPASSNLSLTTAFATIAKEISDLRVVK